MKKCSTLVLVLLRKNLHLEQVGHIVLGLVLVLELVQRIFLELTDVMVVQNRMFGIELEMGQHLK